MSSKLPNRAIRDVLAKLDRTKTQLPFSLLTGCLTVIDISFDLRLIQSAHANL